MALPFPDFSTRGVALIREAPVHTAASDKSSLGSLFLSGGELQSLWRWHAILGSASPSGKTTSSPSTSMLRRDHSPAHSAPRPRALSHRAAERSDHARARACLLIAQCGMKTLTERGMMRLQEIVGTAKPSLGTRSSGPSIKSQRPAGSFVRPSSVTHPQGQPRSSRPPRSQACRSNPPAARRNVVGGSAPGDRAWSWDLAAQGAGMDAAGWQSVGASGGGKGGGQKVSLSE